MNDYDRLEKMRSRTAYIREHLSDRFGGHWFSFIIFNSKGMDSQWSMNGYKSESNYYKIGNYEYYAIKV